MHFFFFVFMVLVMPVASFSNGYIANEIWGPPAGGFAALFTMILATVTVYIISRVHDDEYEKLENQTEDENKEDFINPS